MKLLLFISLFYLHAVSAGSLQTELGYGKAATYAQMGDWKKMQEHLNTLIVDAPDRADLLYDNGVAAYRLAEFDKARAYFDAVISSSSASLELKKQAHFNLGNTHVSLKKLQEAIKDYEAVLRIEPGNKPAVHNLQKIRQMLEQQNQQDKQDDQKNEQQKGQQKKW